MYDFNLFQVLIEIEEAELIEEKERSEREKGAEEMTIDIIRPGEVIQSREVKGQELRDQFCMHQDAQARTVWRLPYLRFFLLNLERLSLYFI